MFEVEQDTAQANQSPAESSSVLTVAIVAGEHSGDILGASLIQALRHKYQSLGYQEIRFVGIAGERMIAQGCQALFAMEELAVMGLVEVLGRLPRLIQVRRSLIKQIKNIQPDIFIGIDAPDFNLGLETRLKKLGIPTVHYVSPSVWAWRQGRIHKIAKATNLVLALLPFEKPIYDTHNVPCDFVGHTLADEIPVEVDQLACRQQLQSLLPLLDVSSPMLAVLPGSRRAEVELLSPTFLAACLELKQRIPALQFVVPFVNEERQAQFEALRDTHAPDLVVHGIQGHSRLVMQSANAVVLASGTATLEAMLCHCPMVVGYRLKPMSYNIFKHLIKIDYFSLPNLLTQFYQRTQPDDFRYFAPELLQDELTSHALVQELLLLLQSEQGEAQSIREYYAMLHRKIRRDASEQAATSVIRLLRDLKESNA